jgi:23S rRNA pseudouridine955/2504/2580 synthase
LGDDKYGDFALNKRLAKGGAHALLPRMFLHAWQLRIAALATGQEQSFSSPLPPDLAQVLPLDLHELLKNVVQKS